MSNCVFGWPNYSDEGRVYSPSLSGGNWVETLPLENVQDRDMSNVARSASADAADTQFEVDLKAVRAVRVIAVVLPNISTLGTVRVRGSNSAGDFSSPVYDSGAVVVYPDGEDEETLYGIKPTFVAVPSTAQSARYWLIEIVDTGNGDGYVDVARVFLAGGWQPSVNIRYGARQGVETNTTRMETDGPATVYNVRPTRRTIDFEIPLVSDSEAQLNAHRMHRLAGVSDQIFWVFDPADPYMHIRAYTCTMRTLSALDYVFYDMNTIPFQLVEEL